MLNNQSILITGGTGTFGKAFVKTIIERYPEVKRLVVFSRDELKQYEMTRSFQVPNTRPCATLLATFVMLIGCAGRWKA